MNLKDRPSKIIATLKIISAEFPADVVATLEAYIEALEANQVKPLPESEVLNTSEQVILPIWSHQRTMEREAHIRERALKKLSYYRPK